jgi:hypothetical protein
MGDIIGEVILDFLLNYPGAMIRWLISRLWGSKKTLKEFSNGDINTNALVALFTFVLIFAIVFALKT